jgi:hypothetical protein
MSDTEEGLILPMKKVDAEVKSPKNLIIFSKPKVGKTTLLANLENCLLVDLEEGSDYVSAMKVKARSIEDLKKIGKAIKDAGYPYKYVALDTITALEEMCVPMAEDMYSKSSMGKNWFTEGKPKYGTILNMPNGAGYPWLREAFTKVIDYVKTWAPRVILVGHVKDIVLEKNGSEFNALDLDLTGKLKRITSSQSDAIGYLYRKGSKNMLSFKTTDEISCGARPEHLRNKEVVLSELNDDETITINWNNVYID